MTRVIAVLLAVSALSDNALACHRYTYWAYKTPQTCHSKARVAQPAVRKDYHNATSSGLDRPHVVAFVRSSSSDEIAPMKSPAPQPIAEPGDGPTPFDLELLRRAMLANNKDKAYGFQ
jgi:hypothetical protein